MGDWNGSQQGGWERAAQTGFGVVRSKASSPVGPRGISLRSASSVPGSDLMTRASVERCRSPATRLEVAGLPAAWPTSLQAGNR